MNANEGGPFYFTHTSLNYSRHVAQLPTDKRNEHYVPNNKNTLADNIQHPNRNLVNHDRYIIRIALVVSVEQA
jgi:hypothetical protein